ncbi:MAG TPA: S-layer homology domain-containing protein, partial [Candidatus Udaeobacter sp.]|nr:S-layer homology domain-containing protein [Candidatus Udaeobacter sp.]
HWASKQLNVMVDYGILQADENGLLHPDEALTIGDWMTIILNSLQPGEDDYAATPLELERGFEDTAEEDSYGEALSFFDNQGWLDGTASAEMDLNQTLTRDQLALILMQMLNYDKLSAFLDKDYDISSLKDAASIKNKGAAALAIKLGLLTASKGKFRPDTPVTKAQASVVLLRVVNIQDKLDFSLI